jgi:GNAT superfamily N-acetyltransferase
MTETISFLEMTSPAQLVPARASFGDLVLREVAASDAALVRETYVRIGEPLGWAGRMAWSDDRWRSELGADGVRTWIALLEEGVAGLIELDSAPNGDVGIVVLGLVPAFIGRGLGAVLLTETVRRAWALEGPNGERTRRVWVQTSSADHPHALPNYEARGFRVFRTEHRAG